MWRRRGSKRKERFHGPWLAVVRSADPPGISVLYKILPGKDYRKPTGNSGYNRCSSMLILGHEMISMSMSACCV